MDDSTKHLIEIVRKLELPAGDWAVFGSCPMAIRGLKDHCHDLDIIARGAAWEKALTLGDVVQAPMRDHVVRLHDNSIEIFDGWKPGDWDIDALIDSAELIDGIPYVQLDEVLKWKKRMLRNSDVRDIKVLEQHLTPDHE